jgi:anti-anti-sigma factor
MDLQIEQREREGIVILDLNGRLVLGGEDLSLLQRLLFLLEHKRRQVIVNLKRISEIDSTGLSTLFFCALRFHDSGGKLVLLRRDGSHFATPDTNTLEAFQEESDAVNGFFPERAVTRYDILEFVKDQQPR